MSLTEPTARPAVEGDEASADPPVRRPAEYPRAWSQLRSLSVGPVEEAPEWADDDRLDELFSAWARAAVATEAAPDGFAAGDDSSPPAPAGPIGVPTTPATPTGPEREPFARPILDTDDADDADAHDADAHDAGDAFGAAPPADGAGAAETPVVVWSRTDDDIIPARRGVRRRWGRSRG